jgi:signal transduction histidine kinase
VRILIVDDHETVRQAIRRRLSSRAEWSVCDEASDGIEAVEKARHLRPDIVLMDISMPRMDGLDAARIIHREIPETDVIIVTQNDQSAARRQAAAAKAQGFVAKSSLAQDLLPLMDEIARKRGETRPMQDPANVDSSSHDIFVDSSKMSALMRSTDWSKTPLGDTKTWSPALRMMVRFMLPNPFPQLLWWGPELCCLYNDSYAPVLGTKHPWALGRPTAIVWQEIWHVLAPLVETPLHGGPATWIEDIPLEINRNGFVEETHFTVAYSPVPDETAAGGIGGVLATVHEISQKVVGERRIMVLKDLASRSGEPKSAEEACIIAAQILERHSKDIPFALFYLIDETQTQASFACSAGVNENDQTFPRTVSFDEAASREVWPFAAAMEKEEIQIAGDLSKRFAVLPAGPWADPPSLAAIVPIRSNVPHKPAGFAVVGISSRLQFDDSYRNFLDLVSTQISISLANAGAYAEERKRAEALAEIDRAKTAFFSNVSHEFRTPLTLMLGPLQDLLSRSQTHLTPTAKEQIELVNRNGSRLLRLVNTLLDFSRIEAGRVRAVYLATDLAVFTAELAGVFRSATDKAGLELRVDCRPTEAVAYVDRDMWEKIVLNLISNAFKFTFEGEIAVSLEQVGHTAELRVRDSGVGIPPQEIPHLFDRFHRVPNTRSRTHEGSGIGLALVHELVKLHGGSMRVESTLGQGSTFFVTIPLGQDHLASAQVGGERTLSSTATGASPFIEEALRWLPDGIAPAEDLPPLTELLPVPCPPGPIEGTPGRRYVLVADDNADMRQYLTRLLTERYDVVAMPDGQSALESIQERSPDLIVSDIMMPNLDGFGLLDELRRNPATNTIPVILLSARAGEESRVEGIDAGADDYLVKPFSARELLARVQTHLELSRIRREAQTMLELRVKQRTEELERAQMDLRDLAGKLLQLQDEERRRVARDLHDSAGQTLAVLALNLAELSDLARVNDPRLPAKTKDTEEVVQRLTQEIRTTSYLLHPPLLDESGIAAALSWYVDGLVARSGLKIELNIPDEFKRPAREMELAIFRIVQECLTNILRHSGGDRAEIHLTRDVGGITLKVRDYGKGIDAENLAKVRAGNAGVGIQGIRDRARQLNGKMEVESSDAGTTITIRFPLPAAAAVRGKKKLDPIPAVG